MKQLVAVLSITLAAAAFADNVSYLQTGDTSGTAFSKSESWNPKVAPNATEGAEYDYVVANGLTIRTASSDKTFGGKSLTLGDPTTGGIFLTKVTSGSYSENVPTVTVADLRVVNAASAFQHGGNYKYGGLAGKITFSVNMGGALSDAAPSFQMTQGRHYIIKSLLHANAECGFLVKQGSSTGGGFVSLMSDNPNFLGCIGVAQDTVYLTAETSGALGPEPDTPTVLLNLRDGGAFGTEGLVSDTVTIDQPKRGISVTGEAGGKLYAASDKTLTTSMFITTEATKRPLKKIGAGKVFVTGSCDVGDIEIQEGWLGLAGDVASDIVVSNNARLAVAAAGATLTLSGAVTFGNTTTRIMFQTDENGKPSGTIVLNEGFTSNVWPLNWQIYGSMPAADIGVTLFRVHPSVRRVSPDDFYCQNDTVSGYSRKYEVTMDEDGMQVVKWVQYANTSVVRMKAELTGDGTATSTNYRMNESAPWADGYAPTKDKDYIVDATTAGASGTGANQGLRTGVNNSGTAEFAGGSLTFKGNANYVAKFILKAKTTVVSNLVFQGSTEIAPAAYSGTGQDHIHTLDGALDIRKNSTVNISPAYQRGITIASDISGYGDIAASFGSNGTKFTVGLEGDNSAWRGTLDIDATGENAAQYTTLYANSSESLGGDCVSFKEKGLSLRGIVMFNPTNTVTLVGANRGVWLEGSDVVLKVEDGNTLTIDSPVSWVGAVKKDGAGTLALGCVRRPDSGDEDWSYSLAVAAGSVKATTTNGVNGVKVALSSGTSIAVEAGHAAGTPLGDFGYYNVDRDDPFDLTGCDGTLAVTVEDVNGTIAAGERTIVNLLTVSSAAADALEGHVTAATAAGKKGVVTRNAADSQGRVTFTAVFNIKGLIISFH